MEHHHFSGVNQSINFFYSSLYVYQIVMILLSEILWHVSFAVYFLVPTISAKRDIPSCVEQFSSLIFQAESTEGICWISRHDIQAGADAFEGLMEILNGDDLIYKFFFLNWGDQF